MLLLASWLPATSWCLLEQAGWVARSDDGGPVGELQQSCAYFVTGSATYKLDVDQRAALPFPVDCLALLVRLFESPSLQSAYVESGYRHRKFAQAGSFLLAPPRSREPLLMLHN